MWRVLLVLSAMCVWFNKDMCLKECALLTFYVVIANEYLTCCPATAPGRFKPLRLISLARCNFMSCFMNEKDPC